MNLCKYTQAVTWKSRFSISLLLPPTDAITAKAIETCIRRTSRISCWIRKLVDGEQGAHAILGKVVISHQNYKNSFKTCVAVFVLNEIADGVYHFRKSSPETLNGDMGTVANVDKVAQASRVQNTRLCEGLIRMCEKS